MKTKGAGLRLWYYNNTDGYIFLPYKQIRTYRIVKQLSQIEVTAIRDTIRDQELKRRAEIAARRKIIADRKAEKDNQKTTGKKLDELSKKAVKQQEALEKGKSLLDLVAEFPPSDGWGANKIKELHNRRVNLGLFPNAKETRFIDNFESWEKGLAMWKAMNPEKAKGLESKGSKESGSGSTNK